MKTSQPCRIRLYRQVGVTSKRNFQISGYVMTSHGRVETTVHQNVNFSSMQEFDVNPNTYNPDIKTPNNSLQSTPKPIRAEATIPAR